jgi:hypothetical protein
MVIRTEYRGQRYSMGSSDPLPAGFEIRFGSLNFQATGNGYLMCINRNELHPWRSTGPGPVLVTPGADAPAPVQADAAGPSTPRLRRRCGQCSRHARMERRRAARVASQRDATTGELGTASAGERAVPEPQFPPTCATPRWRMPHPLAPMWRPVGAVLAATSRRPGTLPPPPTTTPTTAPLAAATHHFARVHGVGLLWCAGPGDVPAVP